MDIVPIIWLFGGAFGLFEYSLWIFNRTGFQLTPFDPLNFFLMILGVILFLLWWAVCGGFAFFFVMGYPDMGFDWEDKPWQRKKLLGPFWLVPVIFMEIKDKIRYRKSKKIPAT